MTLNKTNVVIITDLLSIGKISWMFIPIDIFDSSIFRY